MLTAHYIGDHANDTPAVRAGWALTRLVQKGEFSNVTHSEAILDEFANGEVLIASSSLRDGGVRSKRVSLAPASWRIVDVPSWSVLQAWEFLMLTRGAPYDSRGALATVLPGHHVSAAWFCNEWVGAAVGLKTPQCFSPSTFMAICMTFGIEVTTSFFADRREVAQQ